VPDPPALRPRFNIAPGQLITVVGLKPDGETRGIALLQWGLVPYWASEPKTGPKPINARAETAGYKFGEASRQKQCLIPADGFYEWLTPVCGLQLRRTGPTLLLANGVNVKVISEWLGDADISTTLCFYAHALPSPDSCGRSRKQAVWILGHSGAITPRLPHAAQLTYCLNEANPRNPGVLPVPPLGLEPRTR
jgi:hypothetical protein